MRFPYMSWSLRGSIVSAALLLSVAVASAAPPPKVTISGKVFDSSGAAASNTKVTFRTVGVQTVSSTSGGVTTTWTITPSVFTANVDSAGDMTSIQIPRKMVLEVQVGKSQPRTIYTPDQSTADISVLLAQYNPEIPVGQVPGGGGSSSGSSDTWMTFSTQTPVGTSSTVYMNASGNVSTTASKVRTPAGAAIWSGFRCTLGNAANGGTVNAALQTGACSTPTDAIALSALTNTSISTASATATSTDTDCISVKVQTTSTGSPVIVNCAVMRTAQ